MDGTKGILESKTVWGLLVGLLARIALAKFGISITEDLQAQIVILLVAMTGVAGDGWALYGRLKAQMKLGAPSNKTPSVLLLCGLLAIGLSGCAGPAVVGTDTLSEKECYAVVQAANETAAAVMTTAGDLYVMNTIGDEDLQRFYAAGRKAGIAIDAAEKLCPADARGAISALGTVLTALIALENEQATAKGNG